MKHAVYFARDLVAEQDKNAVKIYDESVENALSDICKVALCLGILRPMRYFHMNTDQYEQQLFLARSGASEDLNKFIKSY